MPHGKGEASVKGKEDVFIYLFAVFRALSFPPLCSGKFTRVWMYWKVSVLWRLFTTETRCMYTSWLVARGLGFTGWINSLSEIQIFPRRPAVSWDFASVNIFAREAIRVFREGEAGEKCYLISCYAKQVVFIPCVRVLLFALFKHVPRVYLDSSNFKKSSFREVKRKSR